MLKTRLWSALVMFLVLFAVLSCQAAWPWWLFVAGCAAAALWEWARLLGLGQRLALFYSAGGVLAGGVGLLSQANTPALSWLAVSWLAVSWLAVSWPMVAVLLWCLLGPAAVLKARVLALPQAVGLAAPWPARLLHLVVGGVWVGAAALVLILAKQQGLVLLLSFLAVCWVADIAAYACGKRWGRHKLAPRVSPGKSWEGAVGGVLAVLGGGFALVALAAYYPVVVGTWQVQLFYALGPWGLGLASVVLACFSIVGDLYESLLKRQHGVKDSSQLLPGHGGVLDRIDAQLPVLPMAWLMWLAATHSSLPEVAARVL